jgi:AI-2 transport protein TqsA
MFQKGNDSVEHDFSIVSSTGISIAASVSHTYQLNHDSFLNPSGNSFGDTMASKTQQSMQPFYWLLGSAALVIVIAGMQLARSLVVPMLIAAFIAVVCTPALQWLQRKGLPGWLAIVLVFFGVSIVVLAVVAIMTGSIASFINNSEKYTASLKAEIDKITQWLESLPWPEGFDHDIPSMMNGIFNPKVLVGFTTLVLLSLTNAFSNAFLVLLTVLFILVETAGFPRKLLALSQGNSNILDQATKIREAIAQYVSLKTAVSLLTGVLVGILVWGLGIDFPFLWAMLAFFFNYIPNIGSIIAAVPSVILALVQHDLTTALIAAVGYAVINIVIGNVIEPRIMGKGLGLSTLVVFISLVFWGWLLGPVGMLLSVPLTMIVKIVMEGFDETRWLSVLLGSNPEPEKS